MIRSILVAYDDSDPSRRAFDLACELAAKFNARLLLLAVVRLPEPTTSLEAGALLDEGKEHYERALEKLRDRANPHGIDFVANVEVGHPAEHVVGLAERERVDLIVMGRRGRTQVGRFILGSTSERVLRYAHCAVTVVK
jgi:nucleotide-binding universal stress UspA family protein